MVLAFFFFLNVCVRIQQKMTACEQEIDVFRLRATEQ